MDTDFYMLSLWMIQWVCSEGAYIVATLVSSVVARLNPSNDWIHVISTALRASVKTKPSSI